MRRRGRLAPGAASIAASLFTVVALGGCGGGEATLHGYERTPPPDVGDISLPNLSDGGADFAMRAEPGKVLVVYFGYTNCPDFCPTTMADLKLARNRLDADQAARIEVAMVTVDPDRDLELLPAYVRGFFDDGLALGTADADQLARAAAPFGVASSVTVGDDGEPEVAHTTSLYAVDDTGHLALTWPFGTEIDQLASDLRVLLDRSDRA